MFIAPNGWFFSGCFWHFRRFRSFPIVESRTPCRPFVRGDLFDDFNIEKHREIWKLLFDGQNPAPPRMMIIPVNLPGFYTSQVVEDFFHQQYHRRFGPKTLEVIFSTNNSLFFIDPAGSVVCSYEYMVVVPQNGWFIMENLIKMGWFGGTTIFGNTHIYL